MTAVEGPRFLGCGLEQPDATGLIETNSPDSDNLAGGTGSEGRVSIV